MYIILGDEQNALTLWYWRGAQTLIIYPIIIADIAPMIPGNLTHFHWPRLLCNKPTYRVYLKVLLNWAKQVKEKGLGEAD